MELFALGLIDGKDEGRHGGHGRRCGNRPCHGVESEPDELSLHGPWGPTESQESADPRPKVYSHVALQEVTETLLCHAA